VVKRDKRNIGKQVIIHHPNPIWNGRTGTILGFRGDFKQGIPFITVNVSGSGYPFRGDWLDKIPPTK